MDITFIDTFNRLIVAEKVNFKVRFLSHWQRFCGFLSLHSPFPTSVEFQSIDHFM